MHGRQGDGVGVPFLLRSCIPGPLEAAAEEEECSFSIEALQAACLRLVSLSTLKISIVELEKSQRQQELLQLKSYMPADESLPAQPRPQNPHLNRELETDHRMVPLELETSKFPLVPHVNGMSPDLSMNGHATPYEIHGALHRPSSKQSTPQYATPHLGQEIVPCTPNHTNCRQKPDKSSNLSLPDYTRFSPAKIALRRHLNQDHAGGGKAASENHPR